MIAGIPKSQRNLKVIMNYMFSHMRRAVEYITLLRKILDGIGTIIYKTPTQPSKLWEACIRKLT